MKRLLVFIVIMALATAVFAKTRLKQFRIEPGDATNPQTVSIVTTYGVRATSWIASAGNSDVTIKLHGLDGRAGTWQTIRAGDKLKVTNNDYPVDTLIVLRSSTSGSFDFTILGAE
jgi:NADPH-dependent ferric siderophore reductase